MPNRRTDLAVLCVAAVWGSSYLAMKAIAGPDTVFAVLTVRFAIAAAVLTIVLSRRLRALTKAEVASGAVGGILLAAVCACETYGVTQTSASNAGLIMALTVVATPILQRSAVAPRFYVAGALAMAGCGLLTQAGGWAVPGTGDMVVAAAALLRAVHVVTMARLSVAREIDPARTTLVQLVTVAAVSMVLTGASGQSVGVLMTTLNPAQWVLTCYLALACTVFAFLIQLRALATASPARVSLLLGTEPLWAAVIGVTLAGDAVTVAGFAGAVLVLTGTGWGRAILTPVTDAQAPDTRRGRPGSPRRRRSADRRTAAGTTDRRLCSP
ncbi:DMT family transporter [Mycolicibacterium wolinskyi]|uniref:DMT family transporter n=1 Tax=Mycolicibacterium TaxID=1866885 RepID=UPI000DA25817|nr:MULTISPECIES: DMT family transporter [Mycolicibacterium]MCV7289733.1 DMT family transporter [Mycolicibacterium wolinskyi]MCV7296704.1 DMT family transporter [Mycolicibacterium goodii]